MKNNDIVISMRINSDMQEKIAFLRQRKFNPYPYFREIMAGFLDEKCKDFKRKEKEIIYPF